MTSPALIAKAALADYYETRTAVVRERAYSDFEIDFELRLLFFLTTHIDGDEASEETAFLTEGARSLGWSTMYETLLLNRIHGLPIYDLEQLAISRQEPSLGRFLFRAAAALAAVDGEFTEDERLFFQNLKATLLSTEPERAVEYLNEALQLAERPPLLPEHETAFRPDGITVSDETEELDVDACLAELKGLIGLEGVKDEVEKLVRYLEIQAQRREHQLAETALSLHIVFTGNPGTGKTTVARIVARIFKALKVLKKGHLVETDRMGLVGQYIGHTAKKTDEVVHRALNGVLFIDEAYSLAGEGKNDFGQEAIDTLVKRMEDYRDRLIVIAAGYPNEMRRFIETNPGLQSRFSTYIHFPDYTADDLMKILEIFCEKNEYELADTARTRVATLFAKALDHPDEDFGNGRFVRNLFEQSLRNHAMRLSMLKEAPSRQDLIRLEAPDFRNA
ncbi:MAG: stage V sporulation protein K [Verrucomicrobiales bacterium]|jgi:stage V sporulation protein K